MSIELERMTPSRAAYFMERFKREEKLLGPNEQAALTYVIDMLEKATAIQQAGAQQPATGERTVPQEHEAYSRYLDATTPEPDPVVMTAEQAAERKLIEDALARVFDTDEFMRLPEGDRETIWVAFVHGFKQGQKHPAPGVPYSDATPHLHVGESAFESWYDSYLLSAPVHQGNKQRMRDAYAAGMGDPLVKAAAPSVPDGYALAPMEPNAAMLEAGYNAGPCWDVRHVLRIYLAMLAASDA